MGDQDPGRGLPEGQPRPEGQLQRSAEMRGGISPDAAGVDRAGLMYEEPLPFVGHPLGEGVEGSDGGGALLAPHRSQEREKEVGPRGVGQSLGPQQPAVRLLEEAAPTGRSALHERGPDPAPIAGHVEHRLLPRQPRPLGDLGGLLPGAPMLHPRQRLPVTGAGVAMPVKGRFGGVGATPQELGGHREVRPTPGPDAERKLPGPVQPPRLDQPRERQRHLGGRDPRELSRSRLQHVQRPCATTSSRVAAPRSSKERSIRAPRSPSVTRRLATASALEPGL